MERIINVLDSFPGISDWRIIHVQSTSSQLYVIGDLVDNIRKVHTNKFYITIYSDHGDLRGMTHLTVFEMDIPHLEHRLSNAVYIAGRVGNPRFSLPGKSYYPYVETFDPTLLGDIRDILFVELGDRLIRIVDNEPDITLSSSEFFLDIQDIQQRNSRGVALDYRKSEIFFDGVLLAKKADLEIEMHFEPRARRMQDLPIAEIVGRSIREARDSLDAVLPETGRYPVVLTGSALSGVFSPLIHHTSAAAQYRKTSQFRTGESIYSSGEHKGEPLTLISNSFIPFGLRTAPADSDGIPASRFELIREGIFIKPWSTRQYADYLQIPATGAIGNIEIPIGPNSVESLLTDSRPVLLVKEFSALMPDNISGNFAAEIKLGYIYKNGTVVPVRGGSVSGNLLSGFQNAHFSTEATFSNYALSLDSFGTYSGPEAIRFENFQITGS